jgi:hypothetical protein
MPVAGLRATLQLEPTMPTGQAACPQPLHNRDAERCRQSDAEQQQKTAELGDAESVDGRRRVV